MNLIGQTITMFNGDKNEPTRNNFEACFFIEFEICECHVYFLCEEKTNDIDNVFFAVQMLNITDPWRSNEWVHARIRQPPVVHLRHLALAGNRKNVALRRLVLKVIKH
jgi:hypothetical protein